MSEIKWTAVIIDDEPSAIVVLKELLSIYCPQIELIGHDTDMFAGLKVVNELKPDILFLDIEMPFGTGFDFLDLVKYHDFHLIFTTAHSHYAIQAIKKGIHDFLMKPIDPDELVDSIKRLPCNDDFPEPEEEKLAVQCMDKIHVLNMKDIVRCESESNYTHIKLTNGSKITVTMTLKSFSERLGEEQFIRVHQSHLINVKEVMEVVFGEQYEIRLSNGDVIPVSHRKKQMVKTILAK